jgi:hypothetical protein
MSDNLDSYLDLPEDPELQLVAFEKRLREQMWASMNRDTPTSYVRDRKVFYVTKIMAFHDAHGFSMLKRPTLYRRDDDFEDRFDSFLDDVNYWTTQIEIRHAERLRPISTILRLTPEIRQQLHSYIDNIRQTISPLQLPEAKKEALLGKLNSLADEIDRDRTKTEAWTAFTLELASTGGQAAKELKPIKDMADAIGSLFGKVKELTEGGLRRIPSPAPRKRIEGPPNPPVRQDGPSWDAPKGGDLDDEIPF